MLAEIAKVRQAEAQKAAYIASDEYKQVELKRMRAELDALMQLYTKALNLATANAKRQKTVVTSVNFEAPTTTPERAFRFLQAQLTDYVVHVERQDYWDDFGYHITEYDVTVSRPLVAF